MGSNQYDFTGASVKAKDSIVNLGVGNAISDFTFDKYSKATKEFLDAAKCDFALENKEKLTSLEQSLSELSRTLKEKEPSKSRIESLVSGINGLLQTVSASTTLIDAYTKWSALIASAVL